MLRLRTPQLHELPALTALCLRSKAVWGYDDAFMTACRAELTLTPHDLATSHLQVAELDGGIAGIAQVTLEGDAAHLEKLFVETDVLRTGAGRQLFVWASTAARELGARTLVIDSDPGAAAFYRRMGAVDDGVVASGSIPGRWLPRLVLALR